MEWGRLQAEELEQTLPPCWLAVGADLGIRHKDLACCWGRTRLNRPLGAIMHVSRTLGPLTPNNASPASAMALAGTDWHTSCARSWAFRVGAQLAPGGGMPTIRQVIACATAALALAACGDASNTKTPVRLRGALLFDWLGW